MKFADAVRNIQINELRDTGMSRLRGVADMCSRMVSDTAYRLSLIHIFILEPLGLGYMQTIAFILVIATLVQFVEMFMKKAMLSLYSALGIFLPLITTNCAVLGAAKTNISNSYSFIGSLVYLSLIHI